MKNSFPILFLVAACLAPLAQGEDEEINANDAANTIILNEVSEKNLGIELEEAVEIDFEETVFAIGRIDDIPTNHAAVSSRIPGRALEVAVIPGDQVAQGDVLVHVESRQPGDPPPVVPLSSPISGTVLERHVRTGEPVEPENKLFDIVDLTKVWAIARVPEREAGRVKVGSKARIRVAALPDELFEGELIRFGTQADATSGTLDAIFLLENKDLHLRPGMRAEFSIITMSRSDVLAVPREAVQGDPANRVVYVEHFELPHAFIKTPVEIGKQNDQYVEIVNGLFPADRVVTTGSYFLGSAGGGGMSLKEALDAAHGHEHNEDGTIMTDEQKAARDAAKGIVHEEKRDSGPRTLFFTIATIILFFLLVLSGVKHLRDGRIIAELTTEEPTGTQETEARALAPAEAAELKEGPASDTPPNPSQPPSENA